MYGEYEMERKANKATAKCDMNGLRNEKQKMWVEMLLNIPGLSEDKAIAIVNEYRSMKKLMKAYQRIDAEKLRENLLRDLELKVSLGEKPKRLGPTLSRRVYKFLCLKDGDERID